MIINGMIEADQARIEKDHNRLMNLACQEFCDEPLTPKEGIQPPTLQAREAALPAHKDKIIHSRSLAWLPISRALAWPVREAPQVCRLSTA